MAIYNTRDLRAEFAPASETQRESKVDGFGRGGSLVTEDGESSPSEQAANAKLLLAAPAMLDALRTAVNLLQEIDAVHPLRDDPATEADIIEILGAIEAATL